MAETINTPVPHLDSQMNLLNFQMSLLNLTGATAEAAGPSIAASGGNSWREEAREVENLVVQYVRVRRRKS